MPKMPEMINPNKPKNEFPKNNGGICAIIKIDEPIDKAAIIMAYVNRFDAF